MAALAFMGNRYPVAEGLFPPTSGLVSGDNHLLKVWQYQGRKIVPPAEFLVIRRDEALSI